MQNLTLPLPQCACSEYGGSFEAGAGTLRLYVHAVALARAAADAAQAAMEKDFQAIDALKERLQVRHSHV